MYSIEGIKKAAADVKTQREARVLENSRPLTVSECRELFMRMGAIRPEKAAGLAFCLDRREREPLLKYLFTEVREEEKETLCIAFAEDIQPEEYLETYEQVVRHYKDRGYSKLCQMLRENRDITNRIQSEYKVKFNSFLRSIEAGTAIEYVSTEAGRECEGTEESYLSNLTAMGIPQDSQLYKDCAHLYVLVCNAKEYRRIGVDGLNAFVEGFNNEYRIRLLRNMVSVMDDFQLQTFIPMLEMFTELIGNKGTVTYKYAFEGLSSQAVDKYERWVCKYNINKVLVSGPIATFWYDYVGDAAISTTGLPDKVLYLDFNTFAVIEIRDNEAAYFYDREYLQKVVLEGLHSAASAEALEDWLRECTDWSASNDHPDHWRKAHAGQWQLAFREYIEAFREKKKA